MSMKTLEMNSKQVSGRIQKYTITNHFRTIPINTFPLKQDFSNYFDKFALP